MFGLQDGQFSKLVYEVFNTTIQNLGGFEFHEENKNLLTARKGDVLLTFRLEHTYHAYLFSLEIKLLGELGETATSDSYYRHLGVGAFAKYSDPEYKFPTKGASTVEELKEMMEMQKGQLLKYCKDIIEGDISLWSKVADALIKQEENSKHKFHRR